MNEWLKNLAAYMLAVSIALQMLPDKKYEQYVRLFTGLLLIFMVLQPVLKNADLTGVLEQKIEAFVQEQERLEREITEITNEFSLESGQVEDEVINDVEILKIDEIDVEVRWGD